MSVVVRMEMPQDGVCNGCGAKFVDSLAGPICAIKKKFLGSNRPSWCPIICQLPEGHGRLVDADACASVLKKLENEAVRAAEKLCYGFSAAMFEEGNTIVPAERSET